VTYVLDSGGLSALALDHRKVDALRRRDAWPPEVPVVALVESLTGDPRRDHATNRLISMCMVVPVEVRLARRAAHLRTATGRAGTISAVDALVVAVAERHEQAVVITSDVADVRALAAHAERSVRVLAV